MMESMLKDPDMEEIVIGFCDESDELVDKLEDILDEYEDDNTNTDLLSEFGQIIDRIMGAAKSIGAEKVGQYCELGKIVSYKSSQTNEMKLLDIVNAILSDTIDIVRSMILNIRTKKEETVDGISLEAFASRLKWLSEKFQHIDRASVAVKEEAGDTPDVQADNSQESIDKLLADLGL